MSIKMKNILVIQVLNPAIYSNSDNERQEISKPWRDFSEAERCEAIAFNSLAFWVTFVAMTKVTSQHGD